nr:T9SS type A sorting domain-containing protein [Bacteroidota bacterium]
SPTTEDSYLSPGEALPVMASASSDVTSMKIWLDEGSGFVEVASVNSGTTISYDYLPVSTTALSIKVTATIDEEMLETVKSHNAVVVQPTEIAALPAGIKQGINFTEDLTQVILVLNAPGKEFVYVVGDFTEWLALDDYQMKQTPDGEYFWLTVENLIPQTEYVFQYWVEGIVKVGDPYADKVADPWNDPYIEEEVYPNLPEYSYKNYGIATVLQTGQESYEWADSENSWERPSIDHLVIYELLMRDFVGMHNWATLTDTLDFLKRLGINAIEIMPVNEFEGNDSWGYNPSYYFAPDKYYGPKNDLKHLIETAHQMGLAVIIDMVLNHAYGQNAMLKMYFDNSTGKPSPDNPWFNEEYVGQYQWGYDFNHESPYTKAFIDSVNRYWVQEYHFDGFRFDFTKGFTNYAPGGNINGFDQSRIDILDRMATQIWDVDPEAYVILEHWGTSSEENILGELGMVMWRNRSYDYVPAITGSLTGSFANMDDQTHVSYFDSHDERRVAEAALSEGLSNGSYSVKNPLVMYERVKMTAAFAFLYPGPKMMWQFDELGYDIHIDFNGRIGRKPLPWGAGSLGYYEDWLRQYIYDAYCGILDVREKTGPELLASATTNHKTSGATRRLSYNTENIDLCLIGNFGLETNEIDPSFSQAGKWYNYFSGDSIEVTDPNANIELDAGEWHIFTTERLSEGMPGVVEVFSSPVEITPASFTKSDTITIIFDAAKASSNGTNGLMGAEKVYMHSGIVTTHPDSTTLTNIVGTGLDDGIGLMTSIGNDRWSITLSPVAYYASNPEDEIFKIGMYFRDGPNENVGMGFRNSMIYTRVGSSEPIVVIDPDGFNGNSQITIRFNAIAGNGELIGAEKVYLHSSVCIIDTENPQSSSWDFAVGNWGEDDGVGEMTKAAGEDDVWEITLTPKEYYGLANGDFPYWVAAVFRSADGSTKGTGTPGEMLNGFIADNLDYFIKNQGSLGVENTVYSTPQVFPNPVNDIINFSNFGEMGHIALYDSKGKLCLSTELSGSAIVDLSAFQPGFYFYRVNSNGRTYRGKIVKM